MESQRTVMERSWQIYSGPILILGVVHLIESLAHSIPLSYFPNYALSLGASVASIGLFTSSFTIAQALLSPKLGGLSDRFGRKKIIFWGLLGDVVLGILIGITPEWTTLLVLRVLNGGFTAAATLPAEALLIDLAAEKKRGEATGFFMAMGTVGRSVGPIFGGSIVWIAESIGLNQLNSFRAPYFVDALLALVALFLVMFWIREPHRPRPKGKMYSGGNRDEYFPERAPTSTLSLSIKILLVASFVAGIGVGFIMPVSVLFYTDKFGISSLEIGAIFSLTAAIGVGTSWFAGKLSDRLGRKPIIVLGGFATRLSGIALPLTANVNQAVAMLSIRRVSYSTYRPAMHALRADLTPPQSRGRVFGLFKSVFNAGDIIGPLFGTWLYSLYRFETIIVGGVLLPGYGTPFFVNGIIGIISTLLILIFVTEKRRPSRPMTHHTATHADPPA